jgi:predicted secreted hydrolase
VTIGDEPVSRPLLDGMKDDPMASRIRRPERARNLALILTLAGLLAVLGFAVLSPGRNTAATIDSRLTAEEFSSEGFQRAAPGRQLVFPEDHGPHNDFQTEWWYFTGNLAAESGARYGYQLTFFRRALASPADRAERDSSWATDQVYFAHFTLTDVEGNSHRAFERFSRGSAGLAGAELGPFQVWLEDWEVREIGPDRYALQAAEEDLSLNLILTDRKGPVLHGQDGYSPKGPEAGNASYYYSLTDLASEGEIQVDGDWVEVRGKSWMDHEFSTSALGPDQIGWDWFSIQLDDGTELMLFQIRKSDGSIDPVSSGTLIDPQGRSTPITRSEMEIIVQDTWRSPQSEATYPSAWTLRLPTQSLILVLEPLIAEQELNVSTTYWEGAVRVEGERGGESMSGYGYVEMTGYAESIAGQF